MANTDSTGPTPRATLPELDRLMGSSGSIQGTPLEDALDEQRHVLWEAQAIVETTAAALERHFGEAWPATLPHFPLALRAASRLVETAADGLEAGVLEDRAVELGNEGQERSATA